MWELYFSTLAQKLPKILEFLIEYATHMSESEK